jgi:hypothetical protein
MGRKISNTTIPWLEAKYSTCEELQADGEVGVVMKDYAAA